ncbi:unnamed protein product, partial [Mesorhabditis belari]|uniref:Uncharacterized protein n=1 Tax=Mesorhabditis belari TaxID=2138241 RepID=A0A915FNI9_9BILA
MTLFFSRITANELQSVKDIYFICNPSKPEMSRKIRIKSTRPLNSWDPNWASVINPEPEDDPRTYVVDEDFRAKKVWEYYNAHKAEFLNISSVEQQKRLGEATNETGGSFLFHCDRGDPQIVLKLAKGFIALAKAINDGSFDVPDLLAISMRVTSPVHTSRIKVETDKSNVDEEMLAKIRHILLSSDYKAKVKTNVASYLNWMPRESSRDVFKFESPFVEQRGNIGRLEEGLKKMNISKK